MGKATITIQDYDAEKSTFSFNIGPLTTANFAAKSGAVNAVQEAAEALIAGEIRQTTLNETYPISVDPVTDQGAQRESKWLVVLRDITQFFDVANTIANVGFGHLFSMELPTALLSLLTGNSKVLSLALPAVATFVSALEGIANSPTGGNEVEVVEIRHVGRNN